MELIKNTTEVFMNTLKREAFHNTKLENPMVPGNIKDDKLAELIRLYDQGKLALQDHVIFVNIAANAVTSVEFFKTDDTKAIGLRNVAQSKLEENEFFCPVAVQLLGVTLGGAPTDTLMRAANYGGIAGLGNVAAGQLDFKINESRYLFRELPTQTFATVGSTEKLTGLHVLSNTGIIKPNLRMEAILKTGEATVANQALSLRIYGTKTISVG